MNITSMTVGVEYLRDALRNRNLIPVVGAGFTQATAGLPSWPGLLTLALSYIRTELTTKPPLKQMRALEALERSGSLLEAFNFVQKLLSDGEHAHFDSMDYQGFLNEVFHDVQPTAPQLATSLRELQSRLVLTTNYDLLLEQLQVSIGNESITWLSPASIRSALRSGSGVIHIHGRYDLPSSVILSQTDYQRLVNDDDSTAISEAIFHSGVLLFVGSSVDGISDPHMGKILKEFARMADKTRGEEAPHVALVSGRPSGKEIARLRSLGIDAISYGTHADLPGFLTSLASRERITIASNSVRTLAQSIANARDRGSGLRDVAEFIRREVYPGRNVRISFAEKATKSGKPLLETRHVTPPESTHNVFNYPVSIAAWSLVEGRIIAWPDDVDSKCDFDLIDRLRKRPDLDDAMASSDLEQAPEIARYVDLDKIRASYKSDTLVLGDFFQDWANRQPRPRYDQFVCVPVPLLESFGNRDHPEEFGVFNIDSLGGAPLRDGRSEELLKLASSFAYVICQRFA
jgi:hypothetical protein